MAKTKTFFLLSLLYSNRTVYKMKIKPGDKSFFCGKNKDGGKEGEKVAKKYNKGRKQKPNFSRGSSNIESASELSPEIKITDKKSSKQNEPSPTPREE